MRLFHTKRDIVFKATSTLWKEVCKMSQLCMELHPLSLTAEECKRKIVGSSYSAEARKPAWAF